MPPKTAGPPKSRAKTRPKVALACDSCREKKIRCDGTKPICGPCMRRSYRNDQCVYNTENSRSSSRDEYVHALHQRIKELEDICSKAALPNSSTPHSRLPAGQEETTPNGPGSPIPRRSRLDAPEQDPTGRRIARTESGCTDSHASAGENTTDLYESPLFDEDQDHITGMGQVILSGAEREDRRRSARFQFYGNSSMASLMRFAYQRMPSRLPAGPRADAAYNRLQDTSTTYGIDDFPLPPRAFADHLVARFFERIFILYPFFHRPAFEAAYRNLWRGADEPYVPAPTDLEIGIGSKTESGPMSIIFHCALNLIFALGCQFADIAPEETESVANSFFLRSKHFIGLDFLDINTIGVVQTLLITALYLQSSPYPSRCWHSVGIACRAAFGLGLHRTDNLTTLTPLESEIRRRTWHGCVIMDIPSMTSHLAPVPIPDGLETRHQDGTRGPSLMAFYIEAIKLYRILDMILSDVYHAWRGRLRPDSLPSSIMSLGSLEIVLRIERELVLFKANVPPFLKWTSGGSSCPDFSTAVAQQRNVLHARYLHLQLLLYRPIFTQLYSKRDSSPEPELQDSSQSIETRSTLYSSMFSKCAEACVTAAIDLTHLVRKTHRTECADAWWYNGFSREAWKEATSILESMSIFCRSATNTLQFLQAAYVRAVPTGQKQTGAEADASQTAQPDVQYDPLVNELPQFPVFDWEEYAGNMAPELDDLGFLTGFNFHDSFA
ncbi:fungal-specific transcription factor domain-containing protein [Aspergillus unguis]